MKRKRKKKHHTKMNPPHKYHLILNQEYNKNRYNFLSQIHKIKEIKNNNWGNHKHLDLINSLNKMIKNINRLEC